MVTLQEAKINQNKYKSNLNEINQISKIVHYAILICFKKLQKLVLNFLIIILH